MSLEKEAGVLDATLGCGGGEGGGVAASGEVGVWGADDDVPEPLA